MLIYEHSPKNLFPLFTASRWQLTWPKIPKLENRLHTAPPPAPFTPSTHTLTHTITHPPTLPISRLQNSIMGRQFMAPCLARVFPSPQRTRYTEAQIMMILRAPSPLTTEDRQPHLSATTIAKVPWPSRGTFLKGWFYRWPNFFTLNLIKKSYKLRSSLW